MFLNRCWVSSCGFTTLKHSSLFRSRRGSEGIWEETERSIDKLWSVPPRRRMSETQSGDRDHLQRTAENSRKELVAPAEVSIIEDISPTVKKLTLDVARNLTKQLSFKAGQWVDFFIPNVDTVGGYSMCSSPKLLEERSQLELAVKYSKHTPAHWVHTECHVGSEVALRVGGDFYYDPYTAPAYSHLLLIAGGVGINPLLSMILHIRDLKPVFSGTTLPEKTTLVYTAKNQRELLFLDVISSLESESGFSVRLHTTQEAQLQHSKVTAGRITLETLKNLLLPQTNDDCSKKDLSRVSCFICGPGGLTDNMVDYLVNMGLNDSQIHYEKWW